MKLWKKYEEYEKFNQREDMYWVMQAKNASKKGFLSEKESADFLAKVLERSKGYIIRKAIENYIQEKADLLLALSRIEKGEETISLAEMKDRYGLED